MDNLSFQAVQGYTKIRHMLLCHTEKFEQRQQKTYSSPFII